MGESNVAVSEIKAEFDKNIEEVWNIVTSLEKYQWRSDLKNIEILNSSQFIEHTKEGYATTFTITKTKVHECWEFDMENNNMKGHWSGVFLEKNGSTDIIFTEEVFAKKLLLRPFVKIFLKKQQKQYIDDLRKALS